MQTFSDTHVFHEGYTEASVQAMQPHFASMIPAPQTAVVPAPVPRGIISRSIRSLLPHFMQPKSAACQTEKHVHDASTNTQSSSTSITTGTNTESCFIKSVGTNTEATELIAVSTNTDQFEMKTVATNTEMSDMLKKEMKTVATNTQLSDMMPSKEMRIVEINAEMSAMPNRETSDPSEVIHVIFKSIVLLSVAFSLL